MSGIYFEVVRMTTDEVPLHSEVPNRKLDLPKVSQFKLDIKLNIITKKNNTFKCITTNNS